MRFINCALIVLVLSFAAGCGDLRQEEILFNNGDASTTDGATNGTLCISDTDCLNGQACIFDGNSDDLESDEEPEGVCMLVSLPQPDRCVNADRQTCQCTLAATDCPLPTDFSEVVSCVNQFCSYDSLEDCEQGFERREQNGPCLAKQEACPIPPLSEQDICTDYRCVPGTSNLEERPKCDDGSTETIDYCNPNNGACFHECNAPRDGCFIATFNPTGGPNGGPSCDPSAKCGNGQFCNSDNFDSCEDIPCSSDDECSDGNGCTTDVCNDVGVCVSRDIICQDDGDDTTIEECSEINENGFECLSIVTECTGGCDDLDPSTNDFCVDEACIYRQRCEGERNFFNHNTGRCDTLDCTENVHCNIGRDLCRVGICLSNDTCHFDEVHENLAPNQFCDPDTGDVITIEQGCDEGCVDDADFLRMCVSNVCQEDRRPACGLGLIRHTQAPFDCVPAMSNDDEIDCIPDEGRCVQFEPNGPFHHFICHRVDENNFSFMEEAVCENDVLCFGHLGCDP